MNSISNDVWKRKGSSVIFDQSSLAPLISDGSLLSLRAFLGWSNDLPVNPPIPGKTIFVGGLETVLETMEPLEADSFLIQRIRPMLIQIQNTWTGTAVVFGFSSHRKAFEETSLDEEVLFRRRDRKTIRLSDGLWDGSATVNMKRVVCEATPENSEQTVGYYVARIS